MKPLVQGDTFTFQFVGWEPQLQRWSWYKRMAREQFEKQLITYELKTRHAAEAHGLIRGSRTYEPWNLEWFVLYQFAGLPSTDIVKRVALVNQNVDESTVRKGIKAAAKLVGWERMRAAPRLTKRKLR